MFEGGFVFLQVLFWDPPNKETHAMVGVTEDQVIVLLTKQPKQLILFLRLILNKHPYN